MGTFYTASPTPEVLMACLVGVAKEVAGASPASHSVRVIIGTNLASLRFEFNAHADTLTENTTRDFIDQLKAHSSIDILTAELDWFQSANQPHSPATRLIYDGNSKISSTFDINGSSHHALAILASIERSMPLSRYSASLAAQAATERTSLQLREHTIIDLRAQLVSLGDLMAQLTIRETESHSRLQRELQEEFAAKRNDLDEESRTRRTELDAEHRARMLSIEEREQKHREALALFETRESKLVRRDVAKTLDGLLEAQEQVSLSKPTYKKRLVTFGILGLALTVSMVTMIAFGRRALGEEAIDWRFSIGLGISSFGFIGTVIYFLRWNDQWVRQHADAEFMAKRYRSDMLRATWVAELVTEWAKDNATPAPPALTESFTKSLFSYDSIPATTHPLEALTGMLGKNEFSISDSGMRIGPPVNK
jgi:hypothetical protein